MKKILSKTRYLKTLSGSQQLLDVNIVFLQHYESPITFTAVPKLSADNRLSAKLAQSRTTQFDAQTEPRIPVSSNKPPAGTRSSPLDSTATGQGLPLASTLYAQLNWPTPAMPTSNFDGFCTNETSWKEPDALHVALSVRLLALQGNVRWLITTTGQRGSLQTKPCFQAKHRKEIECLAFSIFCKNSLHIKICTSQNLDIVKHWSFRTSLINYTSRKVPICRADVEDNYSLVQLLWQTTKIPHRQPALTHNFHLVFCTPYNDWLCASRICKC